MLVLQAGNLPPGENKRSFAAPQWAPLQPPYPACLYTAGVGRKHIRQLASSAEVLDEVGAGDGGLRRL